MATVADYPIAVVVFGMPGCPHCDDYVPVFRQVAARWPRVASWAVDATQYPDQADFYRISETPTTLVLRYGSLVGYPRVGALDPAEVDEIFRWASNWL